jgi:hypothetical protein
MNKFKTSAIEILKREKKPLHYKDITRLALEAGILETEGATPEKSMNSQIIIDIKDKKKASDFIKTAPSIYTLNPNKKEPRQNQKIEEKEKEEEEKIAVEGSFTGKAGEHLVCSELLFRGFNASIMSVDVGIDIAAVKENKFFGIQIKTAHKNRFNTYAFHIRSLAFERHNQGNIFYVFVLREGGKNNFLILPSSEVERKIKEGAIFSVNKQTGYALNIRLRGSKVYLGNMENEISYFLDNWDIIK